MKDKRNNFECKNVILSDRLRAMSVGHTSLNLYKNMYYRLNNLKECSNSNTALSMHLKDVWDSARSLHAEMHTF